MGQTLAPRLKVLRRLTETFAQDRKRPPKAVRMEVWKVGAFECRARRIGPALLQATRSRPTAPTGRPARRRSLSPEITARRVRTPCPSSEKTPSPKPSPQNRCPQGKTSRCGSCDSWYGLREHRERRFCVLGRRDGFSSTRWRRRRAPPKEWRRRSEHGRAFPIRSVRASKWPRGGFGPATASDAPSKPTLRTRSHAFTTRWTSTASRWTCLRSKGDADPRLSRLSHAAHADRARPSGVARVWRRG